MRARQRHFNARDAGATLVLDARRISGLNDGDGVQTWADISRNANDATQATSANRPVYKTSIQGGCPVVRFTKSSTHFMRTSTGPFGAGAGVFILTVASRDSANGFAAIINHGDFLTAAGSSSEVVFAENARKFSAGAWSGSSGSTITGSTTLSQNAFGIASSQAEASAKTNLRTNGTADGTAASALPGNLNNVSAAYGIGCRGTGTVTTTDALDGQIALAIVASGVVMGSALRKRLETTAAYCFKLACS